MPLTPHLSLVHDGGAGDLMSIPSDLWLAMPSRAENVALVRQAFGGLADAVGLAEPLLADVKTAVSEACNNVVVHAYGSGEGPLQVGARTTGNELSVIVRDRGEGIRPTQVVDDQAVHGVGLSLIQALTDRVEFGGGVGKGTDVRMTFALGHDLEPVGERPAADEAECPEEGLVVSIAHGELVGPVLGRVIAMLAARAGFSIDRLSDAQLVSDALCAHAPAYLRDDDVRVLFRDGSRTLDARLGPLVDGGGERLLSDAHLPGIGRLLDQLADSVSVERDGGGGEYLALSLSDGA
ncbi:MAG: ATP-binding protein [Solirubrobacteraceae bacterium]